MWWIRAAIQEYILHSTSIVKMGTTAAQKKLFFNLRQLKGRLEQFEAGDLSPESVATIAAELGVPPKDVVEMNRRMSGADGSLNETMLADGETEWLDRLVDERPSQETVLAEADELAQRRELLGEVMARLNAREREILVEPRRSACRPISPRPRAGSRPEAIHPGRMREGRHAPPQRIPYGRPP
jgi:RNA polymerase sigma-32 factor